MKTASLACASSCLWKRSSCSSWAGFFICTRGRSKTVHRLRRLSRELEDDLQCSQENLCNLWMALVRLLHRLRADGDALICENQQRARHAEGRIRRHVRKHVAVFPQLITDRSEEHTSELQSH